MGADAPELESEPDDDPVGRVSWHRARAFVDTLNREEPGWRLPSEAEWEYACRAGTTTPYSFGENIDTDPVNYDGHRPYRGQASGAVAPSRCAACPRIRGGSSRCTATSGSGPKSDTSSIQLGRLSRRPTRVPLASFEAARTRAGRKGLAVLIATATPRNRRGQKIRSSRRS